MERVTEGRDINTLGKTVAVGAYGGPQGEPVVSARASGAITTRRFCPRPFFLGAVLSSTLC